MLGHYFDLLVSIEVPQSHDCLQPPLDSLRPAMKFKEFSGGKHGESRGGIDLG